jgi:hypothetical protein
VHAECVCVCSVGNALFEALSESVYSEVAALISANENRPHFLIQLFRDLQMISSDPLRQRTLQSIQEVVSRYLASTTVENRRQPKAGIQQPSEVGGKVIKVCWEMLMAAQPPVDVLDVARSECFYMLCMDLCALAYITFTSPRTLLIPETSL